MKSPIASVRRMACAGLLALALGTAPQNELRGDVLVLESGESYEGFFLRESEEGVVFQTKSGRTITTPRESVTRLEMGYTGVPLCYTLRAQSADADETQSGEPEEAAGEAPGEGGPNCDALLHELRDDRLIIAEGPGYTQLREIRLEEVESAEVQRGGEFQKISSVLREGFRVSVQSDPAEKTQPDGETSENGEASEDGEATGGGRTSGRIVAIEENAIIVEDEKGERRRIENERIELAAIQKPPEKEPQKQPDQEGPDESGEPVDARPFRYTDLIPGYPQWQGGREYIGHGMMGGTGLSLIGFYWEYQQAQAASAQASSDLTVLLFNNTSYLEAFERHQQNQRIFALTALLIYGWHALDYLWLNPPLREPASGGEASADPGAGDAALSWGLEFSIPNGSVSEAPGFPGNGRSGLAPIDATWPGAGNRDAAAVRLRFQIRF